MPETRPLTINKVQHYLGITSKFLYIRAPRRAFSRDGSSFNIFNFKLRRSSDFQQGKIKVTCKKSQRTNKTSFFSDIVFCIWFPIRKLSCNPFWGLLILFHSSIKFVSLLKKDRSDRQRILQFSSVKSLYIVQLKFSYISFSNHILLRTKA